MQEVRMLMWMHVWWYVLVPPLGLLGLFALKETEIGAFVFFGWIPAVMLTAMIQVHYRISTRPVRAWAMVLAVPLQVGISVFLLEDTLAFFFVELAFVELFSLCLALSISMFLYRPSGVGGALFSLLPLLAVVLGFWDTVLLTYSRLHVGWVALLIVVIVTALLEHLAFYLPMASNRASTSKSSFVERVTTLVLGPKGETIGLELKGGGLLIFSCLGLWALCCIIGFNI